MQANYFYIKYASIAATEDPTIANSKIIVTILTTVLFILHTSTMIISKTNKKVNVLS